MPEYLAPGVYVEETSFRAKSIEGVGTSTTAFAGPTRKGPFRATADDQEVPELLTSFGDFERIYGGITDLALTGTSPHTNYLAHAVRAFFNEGGSRLYVARAVGAGATTASGQVTPTAPRRPRRRCTSVSRFPGSLGNGQVVVREQLAPVAATAMANAPAGTCSSPAAAAPPPITSRSATTGIPQRTRPPPPRTQRRWRPTPRASSPCWWWRSTPTATT